MTPFSPLPVEPQFVPWHGHQLATYQAGSASNPPVLLVHSINAAASAFEMRAPFARLQDTFQVHAFDFLGFGRSDRPARRYTPNDFINQIRLMLDRIGQPTVVIASSLGAAYAIATAARVPEQVRALVPICPTGISALASPPGALEWGLYRVLRGPVGDAIFGGLATRPSVRWFLEQQTYSNARNVTPETLDGFYQATKHPGAKYAPICFVANLINCDVADDIASLTLPVMLVWGKQARITPVHQANEFVARNPRIRCEIVDNAGMIVQDEQPEHFITLVRSFLQA